MLTLLFLTYFTYPPVSKRILTPGRSPKESRFRHAEIRDPRFRDPGCRDPRFRDRRSSISRFSFVALRSLLACSSLMFVSRCAWLAAFSHSLDARQRSADSLVVTRRSSLVARRSSFVARRSRSHVMLTLLYLLCLLALLTYPSQNAFL